MTDEQISQAEEAIETLADLLGIPEPAVVAILRAGMQATSPLGNQLKKTYQEFIEELEYRF